MAALKVAFALNAHDQKLHDLLMRWSLREPPKASPKQLQPGNQVQIGNLKSPLLPPCQLIPPHLRQRYRLLRLHRHHPQIMTDTVWLRAGYRHGHSHKCDRTVENHQWGPDQVKEGSPVGCFMQIANRPLQPQLPALPFSLI